MQYLSGDEKRVVNISLTVAEWDELIDDIDLAHHEFCFGKCDCRERMTRLIKEIEEE